jgi:hypothetical protein
VPGVLNLDGAADGGEFSVPVGGELDITLQSIGPGSYSMQVMMSSDIMTVLEIAIPAGPVNPAGETQLFRLRALSAGQVSIQIPFESGVPDAAPRTFTVTIDVR